MRYLDANFFILYNFDQTLKGERARKIQADIVAGQNAITSSLALDEVMWVLIKNRKAEFLRETIEDIYAIPNLDIREVSGSIPLDALDIIEKYRLRPRDAFHAAIMKDLRLSEIVSNDSDFDRVEWIRRVKLE